MHRSQKKKKKPHVARGYHTAYYSSTRLGRGWAFGDDDGNQDDTNDSNNNICDFRSTCYVPDTMLSISPHVSPHPVLTKTL